MVRKQFTPSALAAEEAFEAAAAGGLFAVDVEDDLEARRLLVGGDVGQLRRALHGGEQAGRPLGQLRLVEILERVLVLRAGDAAVDLCGMEKILTAQLEELAGDPSLPARADVGAVDAFLVATYREAWG